MGYRMNRSRRDWRGPFIVAVLVASPLVAQDQTPADRAKEVRRLSAAYRSTRAKPEQRAAAIKGLAALDAEGVDAARDLIEKELRHAAATAGPAPKSSTLDDRIADLRKTLKTLRDDPALSHDQLEKIGLPALDQLSIAYRQRSIQTGPRNVKVGRAAAQLQQLIAVLKLLDAQWKDNPPLPVQDFIQKAQQQLGQFTTPEEEEARKVYEQNAALEAKLDRNLVVGMQAVNAMRVMCGLRPLFYDLKLCAAAHGHSGDMQAGNFFAHESPVPGKKTPWDRAKLAGTTASGENIYMGSNVSIEAVKAWFLSPGHHKNMLSEGQRRQGLGREGKYWTQMFGA